MIEISRLYCDTRGSADHLRYHKGHAVRHGPPAGGERRPVVVWNCTDRCNLDCRHCYASASDRCGEEMLGRDEEVAMLKDLAGYGVPVVLFSGGEPLLHPRIFDHIERATQLGMRAVLSTNGTLIDEKIAVKLARAGVCYVGVSIDGLAGTNDLFRGSEGAFSRAIGGIRCCREAGIKVGLRFTITKQNADEVPAIFDFIRNENILRVCFYHLVYAGRGASLVEGDLDLQATRKMMDTIIDQTDAMKKDGIDCRVLTVDNLADGPYVYLRMRREKNPRAEEVLDLLRRSGGSGTGERIGCISWDGRVHPDQFWRHEVLGNIRRRPFSEIWSDLSNPLLKALRNKKSHLKGRCASCRFLDICGGNNRNRAEAACGDLWKPDPACYLTDEEIGL